MIAWIFSISLVILFPRVISYCNPFLLPIGMALLRRNCGKALWGAFLTGLFRDIVLASPRLGAFGFSSLCSVALLMRLSSLFPIESVRLMVMLLAMTEYCFDTLLSAVFSEQGVTAFLQFWSWKQAAMNTLFSTLIAAAPLLSRIPTLIQLRRKA